MMVARPRGARRRRVVRAAAAALLGRTGWTVARPPATSPAAGRSSNRPGAARAARRRAGPGRPGAGRPSERCPLFISAVLPQRVVLRPCSTATTQGMNFGAHIDNAIRFVKGAGAPLRVRTDMSADAVSDRSQSDYDGGELVVEDTFRQPQRSSCRRAIWALSPTTSRHHVTPVTRGSTLVVLFLGAEHGPRRRPARTMLFELDTAIVEPGQASSPDSPVAGGARPASYHNLLRAVGRAVSAFGRAAPEAARTRGPPRCPPAAGCSSPCRWACTWASWWSWPPPGRPTSRAHARRPTASRCCCSRPCRVSPRPHRRRAPVPRRKPIPRSRRRVVQPPRRSPRTPVEPSAEEPPAPRRPTEAGTGRGPRQPGGRPARDRRLRPRAAGGGARAGAARTGGAGSTRPRRAPSASSAWWWCAS